MAEVLKPKFPNLKVFAVEPELSPVISGGAPSPHPLQGIGAGFIPSILNKDLLDGVITVGKDESFHFAQRQQKKKGSSCWNINRSSIGRCCKKIAEIPKGATVLTFNYDTGERYLSIEGLF